jgi:hypothetical protein
MIVTVMMVPMMVVVVVVLMIHEFFPQVSRVDTGKSLLTRFWLLWQLEQLT